MPLYTSLLYIKSNRQYKLFLDICPKSDYNPITVRFRTIKSKPWTLSISAILSMFRTLLRKVATPPHHIQNFASQSGLLSKFCYAKPPTASAVFAVFDRPVFFEVHTCMVNSFKALADGTSYSCHQ